MSIKTQIDRIKTGVQSAYTELGVKGATMPMTLNVDNLASTISNMPTGLTSQVDWNETDSTSLTYIKNKPFGIEGVEVTEILPTTEFVGEDDDGDGINDGFYLFSTVEGVELGKTYTVNYNGTDYECTAQEMVWEITFIVLGNMVINDGEDTGEPFAIALLTPEIAAQMGVGGIGIPLDGSSSFTASITGAIESIKKLENKFLDLGWVPSKSKVKRVLFSEYVSFNSSGSKTYTRLLFNIILGEKYEVLWNGETYICEPKTIVFNNVPCNAIGNTSLGEFGDNTGEPFLFYVLTDGATGYTFVDTTAKGSSVDIVVKGPEYVYNKMPKDFMPDTVDSLRIINSLTLVDPDGTNISIHALTGNRVYFPGNISIQGQVAATQNYVNTNISSHTSNTDIHITADEKSKLAGLSEHTSNTDIHMTSDEKTKLAKTVGVDVSGTSFYLAKYDASTNSSSYQTIVAQTGAETFNNSNTKATGQYSHAEGNNTRAIGDNSHAEGNDTEATGKNSHAEGERSIAFGESSHAEGYNTKATGLYSHAEGNNTKANGRSSHAEGNDTESTANYSHAEGYNTKATGQGAHAEGGYAQATSTAAHSEGFHTIANRAYQHVQGKYNSTSGSYAHVVGNGTADDAQSNAHTIDWTGNAVFAGTVSSSGADYAEYFEWLDGNTDNEDRVGLLVTLDGDKIKLAQSYDEILGIISGTATVLGDNAEWNWKDRFLKDDFGRIIYEDVEEFDEIINHETGEIERKSLGFFKHPKINPNYDPSMEYVRRSDRPEWEVVGLMGKLYLRDDGTCEVNKYASAGKDGVATASSEKTNMRVMERIKDNIIRVLLK